MRQNYKSHDAEHDTSALEGKRSRVGTYEHQDPVTGASSPLSLPHTHPPHNHSGQRKTAIQDGMSSYTNSTRPTLSSHWPEKEEPGLRETECRGVLLMLSVKANRVAALWHAPVRWLTDRKDYPLRRARAALSARRRRPSRPHHHPPVTFFILPSTLKMPILFCIFIFRTPLLLPYRNISCYS